MNRILDSWSIKQKLRAAFGIVLIVLLAVSLARSRGAYRTEEDARRVVEQIQPGGAGSDGTGDQVHRTAASMGFYLKSGEPAHKELPGGQSRSGGSVGQCP